MGLVTSGAITEQVPGEDHTITFHKVSWWVRKEAAEIHQRDGIGKAKETGPELIKLFRELQRAEKEDDDGEALRKLEEQAEKQSDPWNPDNYDTATVLEACIDDWTYETDVTPEAIRDLDSATADWLMGRIFEITKPPDEEEKKDS